VASNSTGCQAEEPDILRRVLPAFGLLPTLMAVLLTGIDRAEAQDKKWATIKGRIVWGGNQVLIKAQPGLLVNPNSGGIKDVFVYLLAENGVEIPVHPDIQKPAPDCTIALLKNEFVPRLTVLREGQDLVFDNKEKAAPVIRLRGTSVANQRGNFQVQGEGRETIKGLKQQKLPLVLESNPPDRMVGRLLVVSHPYYALTNADGNFEINLAPIGRHKLMIYHETIVYRLGQKGKNGEDVELVAGGANLGELKMGKD